MAGKKNPMQFTIRFNKELPEHRKVAAFLNNCGRWKSYIIASALDMYIQQGRIDIPEPQENLQESVRTKESEATPAETAQDEYSDRNSVIIDEEPAEEKSDDTVVQQNVSGFPEDDLMDGFDESDMENILASMSMMGGFDDID